jgi:hypothetical protein
VSDGTQPTWLDLDAARTTALRELGAFVDLSASIEHDLSVSATDGFVPRTFMCW